MHIMIIGAGSLGLLFGAKLSTVCDYLTIVTRTQGQAQTLREKGIDLDGKLVPSSMNTAGQKIRYESVDDGEKEREDPDYLFLMVKQTAIRDELIAYLKSCMSPNTIVVCFQNGIGHEEKLGSALGENKLLLAVTTEAARKEGPAAVTHTGHGVTYIGSVAKEGGPAQFSQIILLDLLKKAGIEAIMANDMEERIWSKLVINTVINPLTAILRVKNGELLDSPWAMSLMRALYEEAVLIAAAKSIVLPDDLWETLQHVCQATAQNHSSMLQDLMQAKGTEIDSMNGSLLRMAQEVKLELAVHQTVYRFVKAIE